MRLCTFSKYTHSLLRVHLTRNDTMALLLAKMANVKSSCFSSHSLPVCAGVLRRMSPQSDPNRRRKLRSYMRPVTASVTVRINVKIATSLFTHPL